MMFEKEIETLAILHQKQAEVAGRIEASRQLWALQNKALIDSDTELRETIKGLDESIRQQALAHFADSGEKKAHPAVGVRETRRGDWDEGQAVEYCIKKRVDLLATKRSDYEKALKDEAHDPAMPGTVIVTPTATLSRDLSDYLPKQYDPAMFEYMRDLQLEGKATMFELPDKVAEKFGISIEEAREAFFTWGKQSE